MIGARERRARTAQARNHRVKRAQGSFESVIRKIFQLNARPRDRYSIAASSLRAAAAVHIFFFLFHLRPSIDK